MDVLEILEALTGLQQKLESEIVRRKLGSTTAKQVHELDILLAQASSHPDATDDDVVKNLEELENGKQRQVEGAIMLGDPRPGIAPVVQVTRNRRLITSAHQAALSQGGFAPQQQPYTFAETRVKVQAAFKDKYRDTRSNAVIHMSKIVAGNEQYYTPIDVHTLVRYDKGLGRDLCIVCRNACENAIKNLVYPAEPAPMLALRRTRAFQDRVSYVLHHQFGDDGRMKLELFFGDLEAVPKIERILQMFWIKPEPQIRDIIAVVNEGDPDSSFGAVDLDFRVAGPVPDHGRLFESSYGLLEVFLSVTAALDLDVRNNP